MNHNVIASSLIIASVITIENASLMLSAYTLGTKAKDAIYTEFLVYLILASIGVVFGLYAMMYPDHFKNISYLLPILSFVWIVVTIVSTARVHNITSSQSKTETFIVKYVVAGILLILTGLYTFVL